MYISKLNKPRHHTTVIVASRLRLVLLVTVDALEVTVALDHDGLLQSRTRRPLCVKDLFHFLKGSAARLNTENEPHGCVEQVERHKHKVVAPVNLLESHGSHVRVVQVGAVGKNDVLLVLAEVKRMTIPRKLTTPIPLARVGVASTSAQYVAVRGVYTNE